MSFNSKIAVSQIKILQQYSAEEFMGCVNANRKTGVGPNSTSHHGIEHQGIQDQMFPTHGLEQALGEGKIIKKCLKPHSTPKTIPVRNEEKALKNTLSNPRRQMIPPTSVDRPHSYLQPNAVYNKSKSDFDFVSPIDKQNLSKNATKERVELYSIQEPLPTVMQLSQEQIQSNVLKKSNKCKQNRENRSNTISGRLI